MSLDWEDNRTNLSLSLSLPLTSFLLPPMVTATQSSLLSCRHVAFSAWLTHSYQLSPSAAFNSVNSELVFSSALKVKV